MESSSQISSDEYHNSVVSQFSNTNQFEILHFTNKSLEQLSLISLTYQNGLLGINSYGENQFLIKNFPKYKIDFKTIHYDNQGRLWLLPDVYYSSTYSYNVPWIYVLNISTGNITHKISTNNSYRGNALCMHNDIPYIAFENSGFRVSFAFIDNYTLHHTVELEERMGLIKGFVCLKDSMVVAYNAKLIRYYFENKSLEYLTNNNESKFHSIAWNHNNTLYYVQDRKLNDSFISSIISLNLLDNTTTIYETSLDIYDILYDEGLIYISDTNGDLYVYSPNLAIYHRKLESIAYVPDLYKLNDNLLLMGDYLINKNENSMFLLNTSKCCWDATIID